MKPALLLVYQLKRRGRDGRTGEYVLVKKSVAAIDAPVMARSDDS